MKKPSIPTTSSMSPAMAQVLGPIKENIEIITGIRGGPLYAIPPEATTTQIINTLNQIIARLNAAGS
jgi:hypothetical protein